MKNRAHNSNRGAAMMIALLSAVVVMLAATLLITLAERMVNGHRDRIVNAQIAFSEASAADGLAWLLESQGAPAASGGASFQLAGVETEFSLVDAGSSGIRSGFFRMDCPMRTVAVPAGDMLVTASPSPDGGTVFRFYDDEDFQVIEEYYFDGSLDPLAGVPLLNTPEADAIFILDGPEGTVLCALDQQGITAMSSVPSLYLPDNGHLAGALIDGSPLLIATGGGNMGILYDVTSGASASLSSPAGTCPTFWPDGSVYGSSGGAAPALSIARVKDVFSGDFNMDGKPDLAFATGWSLSWVSGLSGDIHREAPGGSLVCWGEVENRNGLVGMWLLPDGEEAWYRISWDGFAQFVPENVYRSGWEGRFTASGTMFAGFIQGAALVTSSSGSVQELFSDGAFTGDADGGDTDFFRMGEDGLEAFFNPVRGDGYRMTFDAENTYGSRTRAGGTYVFSIYPVPGGTRVFHCLEGVSR